MMPLKRLIIFFLVLIIFFSPPFYYLLTKFKNDLNQQIGLSLIFVTSLSFPLLRRYKLVKASYLTMGFLSFLLVTFLIKDFLTLLFHFEFPNTNTLLAALLATMIGLWWGRKPHVKKVDIPLNNLHPELQGLKIVHISDLHVGKNIGEKYVENIVQETLKLNPDLIALTGDIGDSEAKLHGIELNSFKKLKPHLGIFYVPGNHEYYWNLEEWIEIMKSIGSIPLLNESKEIEFNNCKILVAGITDIMDKKNPPDLKAPLIGKDKNLLKILLAHRPDPAVLANKLGYDLQLSGHTHGGQFFPWTLVVRFVHRHHLGLFQEGSMKIYVSGGTGSWGPLLRFGSRAELTLLTLR